ncbi:MAG: putative zinc-binding metallopeptidase [Labilithrix sp.]|nr:putative zinc-binding metallopeptidase [Labilithrix sp.]
MALAWESMTDEELLNVRICDLGLKIEGSELEPRVQKLMASLESRDLAVRPLCYLGAEWQSPNEVPAICIPFYLAHPRLRQLEMHQMMEIEGGTAEACDKLIFHESGHAVDHAYKLSVRKAWRDTFGDPRIDYTPEIYHHRPYSKSFVIHLPNWYAQSHPDEDFAETFAVWLAKTPEEWKKEYEGWKAIEKLEYVDKTMRGVAKVPPKVTRRGPLLSEVSKSKKTLGRHYAWKRKEWSSNYPDFYDADLRKIFGDLTPGDETAARFMRRYRRSIVTAIMRWTGERKYTVDRLATKLIARAEALNLGTPRDESALLIDIGSYLAALVSNYLHTGRFKKKVRR